MRPNVRILGKIDNYCNLCVESGNIWCETDNICLQKGSLCDTIYVTTDQCKGNPTTLNKSLKSSIIDSCTSLDSIVCANGVRCDCANCTIDGSCFHIANNRTPNRCKDGFYHNCIKKSDNAHADSKMLIIVFLISFVGLGGVTVACCYINRKQRKNGYHTIN